VALDSLELQLASAVQRFQALQRRSGSARDQGALLARSLAELSTALEEVRVAQEQLVENRLRMEQLHLELRTQGERYWQLFDEIPLPYVVTRPDSTITEVNKAGADLFNVSQRFLVGKTLSVFICEDRAGFLTRIKGLADDSGPMEFAVKLRPRERAPQSVHVRVTAGGESLRWLLRSDQPHTDGVTPARM
jgi:PAS domain-containing protein